MTTPYLLVAEADKIQSFVFRSARRREVVGASFLLKKFCDELPQTFRLPKQNVLTSAGGSFRLVFASQPEAEQAARHLERRFAEEVAGSITTALVPYDLAHRAESIRAGNHALRRAKVAGRAAEPVWHLPMQALCASCGVELATKYESGHPDDPEQYICETCKRKASVDWFDLFDDLRKTLAQLQGSAHIRLPENATEAETYSTGWDPRNYVAYLLADGNHMGKLFGCCQDQTALDMLSQGVTQATTGALAEAVHGMLYQRADWQDKLPCLPLIMGGDDLFVLMPAPWAYDVAGRFCQAYEEQLQTVVDALYVRGSLADRDDTAHAPHVTTGVAVVICKASYPYKLAHQHGDHILEQVKDQAKHKDRSMLAVDLITGGEIADHNVRPEPQFYLPEEARLLLDRRFALKDIATRKLENLRTQLAIRQSSQQVLRRVAQLSQHDHDQLVEARDVLGEPGLLDVLNHWDFMYDLTKKPEDYRLGGEE